MVRIVIWFHIYFGLERNGVETKMPRHGGVTESEETPSLTLGSEFSI